VNAIFAGYYHNIALKSDGTAWIWGYNSYGQLGDGTTEQRKIPVQLMGLTNMTKFAGGLYHSLALKSDGSVWVWGYNGHGQIGLPYPQNQNTPVMCQTTQSPTKIKATITANTVTNAEFTVICSIENITLFGEINYKITYNPTQVTLVDFAAQTPELNFNVGVVAGTDLEILLHNTTTGVLTFKINKTIAPGQMWSGAVTMLKFKSKITGSTVINFNQT